MNQYLLLLHLFATFAMTGIIWFVQAIEYPLMHRSQGEAFRSYHAAYTKRMGFLVGPLMLLELATGVALSLLPVPGLPVLTLWIGLMLILLIWAATALLSIPCHHRLRHGYDSVTHRQLVATNWIRTAAWTLRSLLLITIINLAP
ncbi:MAG: hypothetical protein KDL10_10295 [Kiritimatiellae bacterium]|nr:hypothetical protein [Kiritimatiellia bacterium]